jgi:hypothetical protein
MLSIEKIKKNLENQVNDLQSQLSIIENNHVKTSRREIELDEKVMFY